MAVVIMKIGIYPVDSAIHRSNNWGLEYPFQHNAALSAVLNKDFTLVAGGRYVVSTSCLRKPRRHIKFLCSKYRYYRNSDSIFHLKVLNKRRYSSQSWTHKMSVFTPRETMQEQSTGYTMRWLTHGATRMN